MVSITMMKLCCSSHCKAFLEIPECFQKTLAKYLSLEMTNAYIKEGYNTANVFLALPLLCQCSHIIQG